MVSIEAHEYVQHEYQTMWVYTTFSQSRIEIVTRELFLRSTSRRSLLVLSHGDFDLLTGLELGFQDFDGALEILD